MSREAAAIECLRPDWAPRVGAGLTTRAGGVSAPPYESLNLAVHVGDAPSAVAENRRRLVAGAGLPESPRWLRQVHGARAVHAEGVERDVTEADAIWTDRPGQVCAVLVADCVPILLAAGDGQCVAAVHAGWRGLAGGVIQAAVAALPVPAAGLSAWIGPCIGPAAYEVGPEVIEQMRAAGVEPVSGGVASIQLDLAATARRILTAHGVGRVTGAGVSVTDQLSAFYSYRREGTTGRVAAYIWIPPRGRL